MEGSAKAAWQSMVLKEGKSSSEALSAVLRKVKVDDFVALLLAETAGESYPGPSLFASSK